MYAFYRCKVAKVAPYAVFKSPLPYNTTEVTSKYGDNTDSNRLTSGEGQHETEGAVINPHTTSPKSEHKCTSKDPPRGDTIYHRRTNRKGCKRHRKLSTVAPSEIPSISRAHNTTASMETSLLHASKTLLSNKKRAGKKKSTTKGLSAYQRSQVPPQGTTKSYPQTTSTTRKPALEQHLPTAIAAVTKTTKSYENVPQQSHCCGFRVPLRGDTFQPHCKGCLEQNMTVHMTTVTPSTTTYGLPIKVTALEMLKKTTEPPKQDTWSAVTSATPATTKLNSAASNHKQTDSSLRWNNTSQEPMGRTKAPNTHAQGGLELYIALRNMTGECMQLLTPSPLQHKRPPFSKSLSHQSVWLVPFEVIMFESVKNEIYHLSSAFNDKLQQLC